jgi:hypothetical protein
MLAALAVASSIIVGAAALTHHVVGHFDHGARGVDDAERFALAMERLARDFAAASYVAAKPGDAAPSPAARRSPESPAPVAFDGGAETLVFVSASAIGAHAAQEEAIMLSVESAGEAGVRLIRRRAPWLGSRVGLADARGQDPVTLLEGRFAMSFHYARIMNGVAVWSDEWRGESELPRLVRLELKDPESDEIQLPGADFLLRADAPAACALADAKCLPGRKRDAEESTKRGAL